MIKKKKKFNLEKEIKEFIELRKKIIEKKIKIILGSAWEEYKKNVLSIPKLKKRIEISPKKEKEIMKQFEIQNNFLKKEGKKINNLRKKLRGR